jgi:hypothetical protein
MRKQAHNLKSSRDLAEIARRRLAGESSATIAEALGLSPSQVSRYLARLQDDFLGEAELDLAAVRVRQVAALGLIERELWDAFEISKEPHVITRTTVREGWCPFASRSRRSEARAGSPVILRLITRTAAHRAELLGLYPKKGEPPRYGGVAREKAWPLAAVNVNLILAELQRRYRIIDVWRREPPPPRPEDLPPGFYLPTRPPGQDPGSGD